MAFIADGVWLVNPVNGLPHRVTESAVPFFEARGYMVTDLPPELDSDDPDFIEALEALQSEPEADESAAEQDVEPVEPVAPATKTEKEVK